MMNRMFIATIRQNVSRVEDGTYYVKLNNRADNKSRTIVTRQHYNCYQPEYQSVRRWVIDQVPYEILNDPVNKLTEGIVVLLVQHGDENKIDLPGTTKKVSNNANWHNKCVVLEDDDDFDFRDKLQRNDFVQEIVSWKLKQDQVTHHCLSYNNSSKFKNYTMID